MAEVSRFGVSMDTKLLEQFDDRIQQKGYSNRSEAVRDLVRNALIDDLWSREDEHVVGTVTIVFDHHHRDLAAKLTDHQHSHTDAIVSTLHVHLDAHYCLEVVVLKGTAKDVRKIADSLIGTRGVIHGKLVCTATGQHVS